MVAAAHARVQIVRNVLDVQMVRYVEGFMEGLS